MLRVFSLLLLQIPLMKNITIVVACLMFLLSSCTTKKTYIAPYNEDKLLEHVKELSSDKYEGRKTGERGSELARTYIINQFKDFNISGYQGSYGQPFTFTEWNKTYNGVNILAKIKGTEHPDKHIVISAHYDHLGMQGDTIFNGADDNASGVSALICFAEYLAKYPPKHSVIFASFDAEELGLNGAKYFISNIDPNKIMININMDMISRSSANKIYVVGARYNNDLKAILDAFENHTSTKLIQGHDGTDGKEDWTLASDHGPFHEAEIPFLYFGNEDHNDYHQPTDDFDSITPKFYKNTVSIILDILKIIDKSGLD